MIINAQPLNQLFLAITIINEISKHHKLSNVNLGKYVANPKKYRTFIMKHHDCSKDAAKQLPIILMFGGSYSTWIKECNITSNENNRIKEMVEIENFMKTIIEIVYNANPQIKNNNDPLGVLPDSLIRPAI